MDLGTGPQNILNSSFPMETTSLPSLALPLTLGTLFEIQAVERLSQKQCRPNWSLFARGYCHLQPVTGGISQKASVCLE